jgi:RimJ/RimL family protein N-acetyltransferase
MLMEESLASVNGRRIRGPRVSLIDTTSAHLPAVQRWRSDPEVTRYWITQAVPSLDELRAWLRGNRTAGSITLTVLDETQEPIGYADVFNIDRDHRRCEISLMIGDRSSWGKGYASEVLMALLGYLFGRRAGGGEEMHKVSLAVFAENHAARRVYAKCGFREDGVLRDDMYRDGDWHSQILMSILEHEFVDAG